MMEQTRMRPLTELEFQAEAEPSFRKVFSNEDPFDQPFAADVKARRILFPVYYEIETPLLEALIEAASEDGDRGFYLSVMERPAAGDEDRPYHWYIPFSDIGGYQSLGYPFVLENAIYSPRGRWGVMISHENHALLGGASEFMDSVYKSVPELDKQVLDFLSTWKNNQTQYGSDIKWLLGLLEHVYGKEDSERMLRDFGLL